MGNRTDGQIDRQIRNRNDIKRQTNGRISLPTDKQSNTHTHWQFDGWMSRQMDRLIGRQADNSHINGLYK